MQPTHSRCVVCTVDCWLIQCQGCAKVRPDTINISKDLQVEIVVNRTSAPSTFRILEDTTIVRSVGNINMPHGGSKDLSGAHFSMLTCTHAYCDDSREELRLLELLVS